MSDEDASSESGQSTLASGPDSHEALTGSGRVTDLPIPPAISPEHTLSPQQWGMVAFLVSEVSLFSTLIVTYLAFLGKSTTGPTPAEALSLTLVLVTTACLLSSSGTIHLAERALRSGGETSFRAWWALTLALGILFLVGTAWEWHGLVYEHGLTISRNMFGSTYYTLVGFHAAHVTAGVLVLSTVLGLALARELRAANHEGVQLVSWYWHFVDVVWIVVFIVVYLVGR